MVPRSADIAALLEPAEVVGDRHRAGELGVEGLGETPYEGDVVLGPYATAEGDDSLGVVQPGRHGDRLGGEDADLRGRQVETAHWRRRSRRERHLVTRVDGGDGSVRGQRLDRGPAHGSALDQHVVAGPCQTHDVRHQPGVKLGGRSPQHDAAGRIVRGDEHPGSRGCDDGGQCSRVRLGRDAVGGLEPEDVPRSGRGHLVGELARTDDHSGDGPSQPLDHGERAAPCLRCDQDPAGRVHSSSFLVAVHSTPSARRAATS